MLTKIIYLVFGLLFFVFGIFLMVGSANKTYPVQDLLTGAAFSLSGFFVSLIQSIALGILISKK
jgi:hypothetical protein